MYSLKRFIYKLIDRPKFTLKEYERFLQTISKYKVLPLNEFRNYHNDNEVVICVRHDCDNKWERTMPMLALEFQHNIESTVFVLHSAKYFNEPTFMRDLHKIQNGNFEIGVHNDCMSYFSPTGEMHRVLKTLRKEGINIFGTSAHGDKKSSTCIDTEQSSDCSITYS